MIKKITVYLLLIIVTVFVIFPLFRSGLPETQDGLWAVVRLGSMVRELKSGQFPVRWSSDLNFHYGYPLFNYSYPGVYYLGTPFVALGFGYVQTIKILFGLGIFFCTWGAFALGKYFYKSSLSGLITSSLFISTPYIFSNLFYRGSIGEILAMGILPWSILFTLKATSKKSHWSLVYAILSISLLILVHNATALLSLPVIVLLGLSSAIINSNKDAQQSFASLQKPILKLLSIILSALALSAFFWLPALTELKYTLLASRQLAQTQDYLIEIPPLFLSPLVTTQNSLLSQASISIGITLTIAFTLSVAAFIFTHHQQESARQRIFTSLLIFTLGYIFLAIPQSIWLWQHLPFLKSIDFTWRILTVLTLLLALVSGYLGRISYTKYLAFIIILINIIWVSCTNQPKQYLNYPDEWFTTNQGTTTSANEYLTLWVETSFDKQPPNSFLSSTNINTQLVSYSSLLRKYNIKSHESTEVTYNLMYTPHWHTIIDGQQVNTFEKNGLLTFNLSSGEHSVNIVYKKTSIQIFSELLSLFSLIGLVGYTFYMVVYKKTHE